MHFPLHSYRINQSNIEMLLTANEKIIMQAVVIFCMSLALVTTTCTFVFSSCWSQWLTQITHQIFSHVGITTFA
jgi:hypothetical protein